MQRLLLGIAILFIATTLFSQKDQRLAKGLIPADQLSAVRMPAQDNAALLEAELARRGPGVAPRYATNIEVDLSPTNSGTWESTPNGQVWRLRIHSDAAHSINLGFTEYFMPKGGQLMLYTPDYKEVRGPFTPADNEEHEQLWTPLLAGDEIVIEVQLPDAVAEQLRLKLSYVNHAFEDFTSLISGSCNLDVICGTADGWGIVEPHRDIIQSVAVISTGGGTFCTGFLVNNVENDCKPFFMTAFHCGINAGNAPSLVTYWNFQNSTCRQPFSPASGGAGDGQLNDFNTGSIFRSRRSQSDFVLVELDDPVSPTANAYLAGWDASGAAISNSIGIHHPRTDEKRISFENDASTFTTYGGTNPTSNFTHVRVIDWDVGTTEPGSSGSPLFDQDERVVGQLHGGGAACGNNSSDWYGAFAVSWDAGGNANSRLRDWLDPNNTGTLTINGRWANDCGFSLSANPVDQEVCQPDDAFYDIEVNGDFSGNVTLSVDDLP
ncbi:MAG: trypsin-like peptidase domain-containing protein, partial [Bacteroidota bacterium]